MKNFYPPPTVLTRLWLLGFLALAACTQNPSTKLHTKAAQENLISLSLQTERHRITAFASAHYKSATQLHIYLEGDGTPWFQGREPAIDPTAKNPLALKLMLQDPHPSVYLNRPCYASLSIEPNCSPSMWTSGRYSAEVINSINQALDALKSHTKVKSFAFFAYSGGGALAVLIAATRQDVDRVVTLAANLDHRAWTKHFGYLPLSDSLNAIDVLPLDSNITRWHLIGKQDKTIPANILIAAAKTDTGAQIKEYENFDHLCCWEKSWPEILRQVLQNGTPHSSHSKNIAP